MAKFISERDAAKIIELKQDVEAFIDGQLTQDYKDGIITDAQFGLKEFDIRQALERDIKRLNGNK